MKKNPAVETGRARVERAEPAFRWRRLTLLRERTETAERRGLSGVKAVARRDRSMGQRTRARHGLAVAREAKVYKRQLEMIFRAWLAVGGAHSSEDGWDNITHPERRRSISGLFPK